MQMYLRKTSDVLRSYMCVSLVCGVWSGSCLFFSCRSVVLFFVFKAFLIPTLVQCSLCSCALMMMKVWEKHAWWMSSRSSWRHWRNQTCIIYFSTLLYSQDDKMYYLSVSNPKCAVCHHYISADSIIAIFFLRRCNFMFIYLRSSWTKRRTFFFRFRESRAICVFSNIWTASSVLNECSVFVFMNIMPSERTKSSTLMECLCIMIIILVILVLMHHWLSSLSI